MKRSQRKIQRKDDLTWPAHIPVLTCSPHVLSHVFTLNGTSLLAVTCPCKNQAGRLNLLRLLQPRSISPVLRRKPNMWTPTGLSVYLIGYFQDILCRQTNECEFGQMASTQLNNIYTQKVKKTWKQEKAAIENIIRSAATRIAATTLWVFE